jgi:hypothetical protein
MNELYDFFFYSDEETAWDTRNKPAQSHLSIQFLKC